MLTELGPNVVHTKPLSDKLILADEKQNTPVVLIEPEVPSISDMTHSGDTTLNYHLHICLKHDCCWSISIPIAKSLSWLYRIKFSVLFYFPNLVAFL